MKITKKEMNVAKLVNLKNALNNCGIPAEITCQNEYITLESELWNCINGNDEPFIVFIDNDNTISHYVEPQTDMQAIADEIASWAE